MAKPMCRCKRRRGRGTQAFGHQCRGFEDIAKTMCSKRELHAEALAALSAAAG
jgi:hypothetical protein